MPTPEEKSTQPQSPTYASPKRRILHAVIAAAGWALFFYWWWIVLRRVNPDHVRFTLTFIFVTAVVCVGVTTIWWMYNRLMYRKRGARKLSRVVREDYSRDRLGRNVVFKGPGGRIQSDPVIQVRFEAEGKVYLPSSSIVTERRTGAAAK